MSEVVYADDDRSGARRPPLLLRAQTSIIMHPTKCIYARDLYRRASVHQESRLRGLERNEIYGKVLEQHPVRYFVPVLYTTSTVLMYSTVKQCTMDLSLPYGFQVRFFFPFIYIISERTALFV